MTPDENKAWRIPFAVVIFFAGIGIFFRFYGITANDFFFYDEGLYLNLHRPVLEILEGNRPYAWGDFLQAVYTCLCFALREGKALYFFLSHLRIFWGGLEQWFFPHLISAVFGSATIFVIYLFAKKFFNSKSAALLSAALLAVLPSHVFYSRLALQEGMCAFFFLLGFYFYLFPGRFGWQTLVSSLFLALAYFSNYRLIVIPALILFVEAYMAAASGARFHFRKYLWNTLGFFSFVFLVGNIDGGKNTTILFSWMIHQAGLASGHFNAFNLLSYPYYLFTLEHVLLGLAFFGSVVHLFRKDWNKFFPFAFVLFYMAVFSFAAERNARYICVALPFVVMACVSVIEYLLNKKQKWVRLAALFLIAVLVGALGLKSFEVMRFRSDYQSAVQYLKVFDRRPTILSTQPMIQNLFLKQRDVVECPLDYDTLLKYYKQGFHYLMICPQAYVSFTENQRHFAPKLNDYLQYVADELAPIKTFSHFSPGLFERFVFEHNEDLRTSVDFIKTNANEGGRFSQLKIYSVKTLVDAVNFYHARLDAQKIRAGE